MKIKDRKLKINDTIYVFRVPAETSLDPMDIIKAGRIIMVKVGEMPSVDVNGNVLGRAGAAWNPLKPIDVWDWNVQRNHELEVAIHRTKNLIEAEEKCPGTKLPRLSVTKHRGEVIRIAETEPRFYYIPSKSYCANCTEPILGITKLVINSNGKVCKELPFEPSDNAVQCSNGSKKWLHNECRVKNIIPENIKLKSCFPVPDSLDQAWNPLNPIINGGILEILTNTEKYSDGFARGAAYMFHIMNKGE